MTVLDMNESVYHLTQEHQDLIEILAELGFSEIKNPVLRKTLGRQMTLPRGAKVKGISWLHVVEGLKKAGYLLKMTSSQISEDKVEQLKDLLKRLHEGEALDAVRARFKTQFQDVAIDEIMAAEKSLMESGVPAKEVQKLCDLHAALFQDQKAYDCHVGLAQFELTHPIKYFEAEIEAIEQLLDRVDQLLQEDRWEKVEAHTLNDLCADLAQIPIHYAKKGDLIYPLLNTKYGIIGPAKVMWAKDVEHRQALHRFLRDVKVNRKAFLNQTLFQDLREMCQKERAFLLPLCAKQLSQEDWRQIYEDIKAYETCLNVEQAVWDEGEGSRTSPRQLRQQAQADSTEMQRIGTNDELNFEGSATGGATEDQAQAQRIDLGYGSLTREELIAMLNTIPQEITFVDAKDINRYFNETPGLKHFKRPKQALGRDVYSCHPPQAEAVVRKMISAFKSGERDLFVREVHRGPIHLIVEYRAVRNAEGAYLGVLELVREQEAMGSDEALPS